MNTSQTSDNLGPEYILKSVVCFLGAHYMTYIKKRKGRKNVWKLYDDDNQLKTYECWSQVIDKIVEEQTLPTVLVYERVTPDN